MVGEVSRLRRWLLVFAAALVSAVAIGVPTDIFDTPWFTRMTPVRWWELPVLVATAVLTAVWVAVGWSSPGRRGAGVVGSNVLSVLAVGCPICNKAVVWLLGVSGALGLWAPIQPLIGIGSLALLIAAVVLRIRRRASATCPIDPSAAEDAGESVGMSSTVSR